MRQAARNRLICVLAAFVLLGALDLSAAEVVVRRGDTLASLARRHLGDAERWRELAELNGIDRPEDLQQGMVLRLPEGIRPAAETSAPPRADSLLPIPPGARADPSPRAEIPAPMETAPGGVLRDGSVPAGLTEFLHERLRGWRARGAGGIAIGLGLLALALFLGWMAWTLAIRLACWFSLVETAWGPAMKLGLLATILPVVLAGGHVLLLGGGVWAGLSARNGWPAAGGVLGLAVLYLGALCLWIGALLRVLECRLRSVLTVSVMTQVVMGVIGGVLWGAVFVAAILLGSLSGTPVS